MGSPLDHALQLKVAGVNYMISCKPIGLVIRCLVKKAHNLESIFYTVRPLNDKA